MNRTAIHSLAWGGVACAAILGGFLIHHSMGEKPAADPSQEQANPYKVVAPDVLQASAAAAKSASLSTTVVSSSDMPVILTLTGRTALDVEYVTHVHAQFGGKVMQVPPGLGAVVQGPDTTTQPTVLCVIESNDLAQAKANYLQAKVQLKIDADALTRTENLVKETVLAPKFREDAIAAVAKDKAAMEATRQALLIFGLDQKQIDQIETEQGKQRMDYVITSPRSGVVAEKGVSGGEIADPTINLFTIADTSKMWVFGDVYERDLKRVKPGQKARIILTSDPDHPRDFTIDWISPELDPNTHSVRVRGTVDNKDGAILADMYGTILVTIDPGTSSLVIPADAVVRSDKASFVFVKVPGGDGTVQYRKTPVTVEPLDVGFGTADIAIGAVPAHGSGTGPVAMLRISGGLHPGETVVDHGALGLFSELQQDSQ